MSDLPTLRDHATLRRLLYLAAFLLIAPPVAQALSQLWPWQLRAIQWRYSAATVLTGALALPATGLVLAMATAIAARQRGGQLAVGVLGAVGAVGLLACSANFVLDALQLREIVTSANMPAFTATTARVLLLCTLYMPAFAWLAVAGLAGGGRRSARRGRRRDEELGLLVAQDD
jgi:hypothetical protein